MVIEYLCIGDVSYMALEDVSLLGDIFYDDIAINILNIIYELYQDLQPWNIMAIH